MELLNRNSQTLPPRRPIKVVQFGEGNFLRAFVDFAFHKLNTVLDFNAGIAVVQPIDKGLVPLLNDQDGLYTLFIKGVVNEVQVEDKYLIDAIVQAIDPYANFPAYMALAHEPELEFIISNTTEAGIAFDASDTFSMTPPKSFPAKLTKLLYERFVHYNGNPEKGVTIIPCELINYNADTLKKFVLDYATLWNLGVDFTEWLNHANSFHNTLVDRIVPGYPKDDLEAYRQQLDYTDNLMVTSEVFFLWVIEGDVVLREKLPFQHTGLDVKIVDDMQPYRTRKVRILNGAHTSMVPLSLLYGNETVEQSVSDAFTGEFVKNTIFHEIIPTLELSKQELHSFAHAVLDRFRNPFIKHFLASIALNSISKFKVRVLPSLLRYHEIHGVLPTHLVYAFACLLRFYKGEWKGNQLPVNDDPSIVAELQLVWAGDDLEKIVGAILGNQSFWDRDLNHILGLAKAVGKALESLEIFGVEKGFEQFSKIMAPAL